MYSGPPKSAENKATVHLKHSQTVAGMNHPWCLPKHQGVKPKPGWKFIEVVGSNGKITVAKVRG